MVGWEEWGCPDSYPAAIGLLILSSQEQQSPKHTVGALHHSSGEKAGSPQERVVSTFGGKDATLSKRAC